MLGAAPFIRVVDDALAAVVAGATPPVEGGATMTVPVYVFRPVLIQILNYRYIRPAINCTNTKPWQNRAGRILMKNQKRVEIKISSRLKERGSEWMQVASCRKWQAEVE
jgi:hypothetical protein